jgi:hypothetical protein
MRTLFELVQTGHPYGQNKDDADRQSCEDDEDPICVLDHVCTCARFDVPH